MTTIYFAGVNKPSLMKDVNDLGVKNILSSYYYISNKKQPYTLPKGMGLFLDSGGFTARMKEEEMSVQDYINFIKKNPHIKVYANLDVATPEETLTNQETMEKQGLKPLPVFHYSEMISKKWNYLMEEYCQEYDYVAIGGLKTTLQERRKGIQKNKQKYLNFCFSIANKYNTKIHGFGMTHPKFISKYPFHSVDSTSWLSGSMYGLLYFYEHGTINIFSIKKWRNTKQQGKQLDKFNAIQWVKYANYLKEKKV